MLVSEVNELSVLRCWQNGLFKSLKNGKDNKELEGVSNGEELTRNSELLNKQPFFLII